MEKESYLGESTLLEQPKKKLNFKIRDGSITVNKLDPELYKAITGSSNIFNAITNSEIDTLWDYREEQ